MNKEIKDF
jgi:chromosome segregation ATPase